MVAGQVVVGLLVALVAWGLTGKQDLGWSAGYGALAVVIPAAMFARGLTGRFSSLNAGTAVVGFMLWEMVKMALTVAMLIGGAEAGGGAELAGIAGGPGAGNEGVLGGVGVRPRARRNLKDE